MKELSLKQMMQPLKETSKKQTFKAKEDDGHKCSRISLAKTSLDKP